MTKKQESQKYDKKKKKDQIRILAWGDSPAVATGFATVTRNIFSRLAKKDRFLVDFIGINDSGGWKDPKEYGKNLHIYPALSRGSGDPYGRPRLLNGFLLKDQEIIPPWDIVWTLNDPFILEQNMTKWGAGTLPTLNDLAQGFKEQFPPAWWYKIISYWPIDSNNIKENWYKKAIAKCHYPVAYTEFGKEVIEKTERALGGSKLENPLEVIYHGVDTKIFFPLSEEEKLKKREEFFMGKVKPDTFLCTIVARNQPRKDIPRAMKVFREFQKKRPDAFLYIHAKNSDAGGTLTEYGRMLGLKEGEDYGFPARFEENKGVPVEALNIIYNMSDALISTTLGEGFGLPFLEAMATKTINVSPDNTTIPELFNIEKGDGIEKLKDPEYRKKIRGIPVKSESTSSEFYVLGDVDYERFRPLTNVEDMVQKLLWVYDNPNEVKEIENQAHKWVQDYDWDIIADQWEELFERVFAELNKERSAWTPPKDYKEGQIPKRLNIKVPDTDEAQSYAESKDTKTD